MAEEHHGGGGASPGIRVEAESSSEQRVASSRGAMSREDCVEGIRSALKRTRAPAPSLGLDSRLLSATPAY